MNGMAAKQKITEMQTQELMAKSSQVNDRVDILSKEVGQVAVNQTKNNKDLGARLGKIEQLLTRMVGGSQVGASQEAQPIQGGFQTTQAQPRFFNSRGNGRPAFRGPRLVQPSITGGVGYINNVVRPASYRPQGPAPQAPVSAADNAAACTAPSAAMIGAMTSDASTQPQETVDSQFTTAFSTDYSPATAAHPLFDPQQQAFQQQEFQQQQGWWSPGMPAMGAMGYDESYNGTLSYGNEGFWLQ